MVLGPHKRAAVEKHIAQRLEVLQRTSPRNYVHSLRDESSFEENSLLIEAMTVNETYFYRESDQFDAMVRVLLPDILTRKSPGSPIRIWSIPCATGEEPYSIALWLLEHFPPN